MMMTFKNRALALPMLMLFATGCSRSEPPQQPEPQPTAMADTNVPWITIQKPTVIVCETVEHVEPDPFEMQQRQDVRGMALIDDRPKEEGTAQPEN
jgi:hypothetical protein